MTTDTPPTFSTRRRAVKMGYRIGPGKTRRVQWRADRRCIVDHVMVWPMMGQARPVIVDIADDGRTVFSHAGLAALELEAGNAITITLANRMTKAQARGVVWLRVRYELEQQEETTNNKG